MIWADEVLAFWFGLAPERHWTKDEALDAEITDRFKELWEAEWIASKDGLDQYLTSADQALGAIILFDQFPRNMFRGSGHSFATDPLARRIADAAIERGYDQELGPERRVFMYLPFEHSEALSDQDRSVALFESLGDARYLDFARKHREVIARFGRFPHRNAMLGRESTAEEQAFGLEPAW